MQFNIFCDESCHLEHDRQKVMVLGAISCPTEKAREIAVRIREIKEANGVSPRMELKWGSVSPAKLGLYRDIIDYFFDDDDLAFRAVVADKANLDHDSFGQSHDDWYFKMYYTLLSKMLSPSQRYRIFLDIKDTRSGKKAKKLREVLCNSMLDFDRDIIEAIQLVRSHEVEQVQLADLLTGAVGYANRGLTSSEAKSGLVDRIKQRSKYSLIRTTLLSESKFNLFQWSGVYGSRN
jgi:hypothetical protein